jgi:hypothetical protein
MEGAVETPKSRHTGRIPRLTPELQKLFFETLQLTGFQRHAAMSCGVQDKTVCLWKTKGRQQKSGIYRDFVEAFDKFKAERIAAGAELHYQVAHGQIYKGPKYVYLKTIRGDLIRTNEVVKNENGDLVMVDCCDGINLKAIEWELARLDPETYAAKKADTRVNNRSSVDRVSLSNVLHVIGLPLAR